MTPTRRILSAATAIALLAVCSACSSPGPDPTQSSLVSTIAESASPGGDAVVRRRDFQILYRLDAATESSSEIHVVAYPGTHWRDSAAVGEVSRGSRLGEIVVDEEYRSTLENGNRLDQSTLAMIEQKAGNRISPADGTLEWIESTAVIKSVGMDVIAPLSPLQALRLLQMPIHGTASVETMVGAREVECIALWITEDDEDGSSPRLHCRLPATIETAPGLRATLMVQSDVIVDALVVPNVMIGADDDGPVVTFVQDGREVTVPVMVGATDGVVRVVLGDLPVGAALVEP